MVNLILHLSAINEMSEEIDWRAVEKLPGFMYKARVLEKHSK